MNDRAWPREFTVRHLCFGRVRTLVWYAFPPFDQPRCSGCGRTAIAIADDEVVASRSPERKPRTRPKDGTPAEVGRRSQELAFWRLAHMGPLKPGPRTQHPVPDPNVMLTQAQLDALFEEGEE